MSAKRLDVLLVGAGTMSSTLGVLLKQLNPDLNMGLLERLDDVAQESSSGWNNAGTGHAAYCELNYTPEMPDGSINADKAYSINSLFEISLQFWSYLVQKDILPDPEYFIAPTPHISFVWGDDNVEFLRKRYELLSQHHLFSEMEYSEDPAVLETWMPLIMQGRDPNQRVAATRVMHGADVNYGSLSRSLVGELQTYDNFDLMLGHSLVAMTQRPDGKWDVRAKNHKTDDYIILIADFVFLGAGGNALPLLQESDIPEADNYGGFPVSGQWLVCRNPELVKQHLVKVYGKASLGAPPMSVPHLDARIVDGENALLFGPFAGFTTKFLKKGSFLDLIASIRPGNIKAMLQVAADNWSLIKYLVGETLKTRQARMKSLREYYPEARDEDWEWAIAGQRVQIIKKDEKRDGKLEFGTEVVTSADRSLGVLLGASPGASVAVNAMLQILERCFAKEMEEQGWKDKIKTMIPSYGESLADDAELLKTVRKNTLSTLKLGGQATGQ